MLVVAGVIVLVADVQLGDKMTTQAEAQVIDCDKYAKQAPQQMTANDSKRTLSCPFPAPP